MSSTSRRRDFNSKLHMDRQPTAARISDPSLAAGKRREIDNVMKKARANTTNEYWDKKLLEVEEKDPNRWRHTGYKKMYIQGESSSGESDREVTRYRSSACAPPSGVSSSSSLLPPPQSSSASGGAGRYGRSRSPRSPSRSRLRKSPPLSPPLRRRSPPPSSSSLGGDGMRGRGGMSPPASSSSMDMRLDSRGHPHPRSPPPPSRNGGGGRPLIRSPPDIMDRRRPLGGGGGGGGGGGMLRPRSPQDHSSSVRAKTSRSPLGGGGLGRRLSPPPDRAGRRRSPISGGGGGSMLPNKRMHILPRSKRPPSPPPRGTCRSRSNSSISSCSDDSCSVCSPTHGHTGRGALHSHPRARPSGGPKSPPPSHKHSMARSTQYRNGGGLPPPPGGASAAAASSSSSSLSAAARATNSSRLHGGRPASPPPPPSSQSRTSRALPENYRETTKVRHMSGGGAGEHRSESISSREGRLKNQRLGGRHSPPEDPRLKHRPPEPPEPAASSSSASAVAYPAKKKKKEKQAHPRIKIEGEKRKKHSSTESDDSNGSDSEGSLPTFTATTRLTLSERFGKMAQWSIDRSNMENMRITKDSTGGALKVMIEEGLDTPPRRYSYSPAPVGHFPEELATTAPSGMLSWDDVRVRYEYYKSRGYLRDLDLKDYVKWEEWWYKYQEWLKQERYYEYWERSQLARRRRKKLSVAQRLN